MSAAALKQPGMDEAERRARLEKALAWGGNTHAIADVVQMCRDGRAQYWERGNGHIITELKQYPKMKTVVYWLIWGDLHDCLALDAEISAWAIEQGCTKATAMGRKGWGRVASGLGWKPHLPSFYKDLAT